MVRCMGCHGKGIGMGGGHGSLPSIWFHDVSHSILVQIEQVAVITGLSSGGNRGEIFKGKQTRDLRIDPEASWSNRSYPAG